MNYVLYFIRMNINMKINKFFKLLALKIFE